MLQDHVIAKDGGELEFGPGEREEAADFIRAYLQLARPQGR